MKVGDIVKQGSRVIEIRGRERSKIVGTVVAIHDLPIEMKNGRHANWTKLLGSKTVDVLWSNGKLSENFAENSLEVVINEDS